ncbi:M18 family aminopeptidase [Streptomyces sp. NPDC058086]|jgi:aspartyl aminopeptidase|uniref:M18 family aminopeptidase n=1 Tax=Streptomyces sp. NPDC058086 TaxID=3346334 RepID=UPI0036E76CC4
MSPTHDRSHSDDLLSFIRSSPSPYHVVANAAQRLEKAGFQELRETDDWTAGAEGGRYVVRAGALLAWYVPAGAPARTPFRIVGAHTDSPNLRIKPEPDTGSAGWRQIAVEIYGGVPHNTWLDRDLGISGRLTLRDGASRLVCVDRPLLRVPQLAIHLDRAVNEGVALDPQLHMTPLWGLGPARPGALLARVAAEADTDVAEVLGWDLMLHDIQPPGYLGADEEFLVSPRLDNQISVHAGVTALVAAATAARPPAHIPVLAAFDHEEVGSGSQSGAQGPLLERVLGRSVAARGGSAEDFNRALAGAFCVSADMSHAVHPNYAERHDPDHHPLPNGGPVVKVNVNQRYATDGTGVAAFAAACERAEVPWQPFVSHNAMPCGTSIGPITAARLGVATVDVGVPGLSMHSARELCGAQDPGLLARVLTEFVTTG